MKKLILLSILFATVAIPSRAANDANPRRAMKKAIRNSVIFFIIYWLLLLFVYPHFSD